MRTTIATHELLPKDLYLENLSIETGRITTLSCSFGSVRLTVCQDVRVVSALLVVGAT